MHYWWLNTVRSIVGLQCLLSECYFISFVKKCRKGRQLYVGVGSERNFQGGDGGGGVCVCVCVCSVLIFHHLTFETALRCVNENAAVRLWFMKLSVKTFDLRLSRQHA
jgi:hypothetical protein